ncbi:MULTISPECIES: hypothetical protein [Xanthomonas]|uniref:hypothetical protein n=1 Tax=Xanthomonas TaxID=338 RepID=UPI00225E687A|nr:MULTISPECIES: hypothetical protein [Xanthomonas]MDY4295578.1 hypothetical protein [Xanthomonas sp. LF02-5]MDY4357372.1 hypothetical protein [Xanthomonas sp. LF04-12]
MKELRFPKELTVRFHLDGSNPTSSSSGQAGLDALATIEKNGSELIMAAVTLEDRMIQAVSKLLFGTTTETRKAREFFAEEIMGTSDFSYAFKRRVFTRLLEISGALDSDSIKELKAGLNKVMEWRNAFAHGKVLQEYNAGYVLQYYSGGRKELLLDDAFFEAVESTLRNCLYTCNGVIQTE